MYFEDVFYPIIKLWKTEFYLEYGNKKKSYVLSIGDDYDEVEYIVDVEQKDKYNEWHRMMVFTIYSTITDYGLNNLSKEIYSLNLLDIPIESFQKEYLENLREEGNERYLNDYKGFKNPY
jgi:hypothetical protein